MWFCSKFQRNKCSHTSSHAVTANGGKTRFAKHICATFLQTDKKELVHPECFPGDTLGECTCYTNDGIRVVYYMIASSDLYEYITNFEVIDYDESDHLPIACTIALPYRDSNVNPLRNNFITPTLEHERFCWNDNHISNFITQLCFVAYKIR